MRFTVLKVSVLWERFANRCNGSRYGFRKRVVNNPSKKMLKVKGYTFGAKVVLLVVIIVKA